MSSQAVAEFEGVKSLDPGENHDYIGLLDHIDEMIKDLLDAQEKCRVPGPSQLQLTGMLSIAVHKFRKLHFDCFDGTTGEAVSGATVSFMQWTLAQGIPVIQACIDELKKLHALRYAMSVLHDKLPPWIIREMNPIGVEIMTRLGRLMEHACFGDWTA